MMVKLIGMGLGLGIHNSTLNEVKNGKIGNHGKRRTGTGTGTRTGIEI